MRVLCFGDSITQGFWDLEGGWVNRLRKHFDVSRDQVGKHEYVSVFNLGVDGNTTADILKRLKSEADARIRPDGDCAFVFATGTNDGIFTESGTVSSPERYATELAELLDVCKPYGGPVMFVGLTPVDDAKLNPMPWSNTGECYSTERAKLFDDALRDFCEQRELPYVSLWETFAERNLDDVMVDGDHPNDDGHELIAQKVAEKLEEII